MSRSNRKGVTLIETLVVIAIIGILAALILPAIQKARESARRMRCTDNLRQLSLSLNAYNSSMGVLPMSINGNRFSIHAMILPFIDQKPLYDSINFSLFPDSSQNKTVLSIAVDLFICPSDFENKYKFRNYYYGNRGVGYDEEDSKNNGFIVAPLNPPINISDCIDGSSVTAALCESLPSIYPLFDNKRDVFMTSVAMSHAKDFDQFSLKCMQSVTPSGVPKGDSWIQGDFIYTNYNHTLGVNQHSCTNGTLVQQGAWTASSVHTTGAFCAFADGHVSFIKESMNLSVWRAIGTRNGGEVIDDVF